VVTLARSVRSVVVLPVPPFSNVAIYIKPFLLFKSMVELFIGLGFMSGPAIGGILYQVYK